MDRWQADWAEMLAWNAAEAFRPDSSVLAESGKPLGAGLSLDVAVTFGPPLPSGLPHLGVVVWASNADLPSMMEIIERCDEGGVEELIYIYPVEPVGGEGYRRADGRLSLAVDGEEYTSERLGFRIALEVFDLAAFGRDGRRLTKPDGTLPRESRICIPVEMPGSSAAEAREGTG